MPTVSIKKDWLFGAIGKIYSDDEFANLCFEFGLELDEVTSERQMMRKETGTDSNEVSDEVLYRIDVPANRYDLLCMEGLARGILIFQGRRFARTILIHVTSEQGDNQSVSYHPMCDMCTLSLHPYHQYVNFPRMKPPEYIGSRDAVEVLIIKSDTEKIRPFCVAAVLRNITLTADSYNSFIDLQDKLHQNLCRKRTLVAIGTHDLDTLKGPFVYDALPPEKIEFIPLNQSKAYNGVEIMELYSKHAQLKQYLPIIKDSPVYPVITDANGVVLSLPPIINGNHSKISTNTRNIFIECTATDLHKAEVVLDTLVCMFSQYCAEQFHVERVRVTRPDGTWSLTPELQARAMRVDAERVCKVVGVTRTPSHVAQLLQRMGLTSLPNKKSGSPVIKLVIPPTRHDVLHERDIVEDVAIAQGYNNIEREVPNTSTVGKELPVNKLSDMLREEAARCGFTEALTFSLCSIDDIGKRMGRKIEELPAVHISNPKTLEFQVARTHLLPCLLKTLSNNKKMALPLRIFEVSDVVVTDEESEVGARNSRRLSAVSMGRTAGFEIIHGLLDRLMQVLDVKPAVSAQAPGYSIRAAQDPAFFPKRYAEILYNGCVVGSLGVLHPNVLKDFELTMPCSGIELDVEPFL